MRDKPASTPTDTPSVTFDHRSTEGEPFTSDPAWRRSAIAKQGHQHRAPQIPPPDRQRTSNNPAGHLSATCAASRLFQVVGRQVFPGHVVGLFGGDGTVRLRDYGRTRRVLCRACCRGCYRVEPHDRSDVCTIGVDTGKTRRRRSHRCQWCLGLGVRRDEAVIGMTNFAAHQWRIASGHRSRYLRAHLDSRSDRDSPQCRSIAGVRSPRTEGMPWRPISSVLKRTR
ncbi:hypothetical protein ABIE52_000249 [Rhodococcus sp. OAS809]|jgi:hypothetical protein